MIDIKKFLTEASISSKKRDVTNIRKMFINGKEMGGIRTFGIVTSQNPNTGKDMDDLSKGEKNSLNSKLYKDLKDTLKDGHYKFVPAEGKFDNTENSFVILNITLDKMQYFAGKYEQTSFFFCYPKNNELNCEYWAKKDESAPYDKKKNPYVLIETSTNWSEVPERDNYYTAIGKSFKFTINCKCFESVNDEILQGLQILSERLNNQNVDVLLDTSMRTGENAYNYRKVINSVCE